VSAIEILLTIRALAGLAETLLIENREATQDELDRVDARVVASEDRLRRAIQLAGDDEQPA